MPDEHDVVKVFVGTQMNDVIDPRLSWKRAGRGEQRRVMSVLPHTRQ